VIEEQEKLIAKHEEDDKKIAEFIDSLKRANLALETALKERTLERGNLMEALKQKDKAISYIERDNTISEFKGVLKGGGTVAAAAALAKLLGFL